MMNLERRALFMVGFLAAGVLLPPRARVPAWDLGPPVARAAAAPAVAGERRERAPVPLDRARELALKAPDPATRRQAVQILGEDGGMAEVPILVQALRDGDELVRVLAEEALWRVFLRSGDPEVDRLMSQGSLRMQQGDFPGAVQRFDQAIARSPRFAEGYNKRATVYYLMGRHQESIADCERTLALNPWHFGALAGEGLNYAALGDPGRALEYFERALTVHPHLEGARRNAELIRQYLRALERESL